MSERGRVATGKGQDMMTDFQRAELARADQIDASAARAALRGFRVQAARLRAEARAIRDAVWRSVR